VPALQHLAEAERLLSSIPLDLPNLKKDGRQKMAELRIHFAQLASAYRANSDPFIPAAVIQEADVKDEDRHEQAATTNWKMLFSDVESDLTAILGGGASLPPSTPAGAATIVNGVTGPVGTSGATATAPAPVAASGTAVDNTQPTSNTPLQAPRVTAVVGDIGIKDLDPEIRRQLEQFRLELELFFGETTMNFDSAPTR
jgi:hypothetical protein